QVTLEYALYEDQKTVDNHKAIFRVRISPDSRWMVTTGNDKTKARLWNMSKLDRSDPMAGSLELGRVSEFQIRPDSRWLILVRGDKTVSLCNLADSAPVAMSRVLKTEAG